MSQVEHYCSVQISVWEKSQRIYLTLDSLEAQCQNLKEPFKLANAVLICRRSRDLTFPLYTMVTIAANIY